MYSNVTSITQVRTAARRDGPLLGRRKRSGLGPHVGTMRHAGKPRPLLRLPDSAADHRLLAPAPAEADSRVADAGGRSRTGCRGSRSRARSSTTTASRASPSIRRPAARSPTTTTRGTRTVNLSQGVYDGHAVASAAIAAHEVGHAIQHEKAYGPFKLRSAIFPAVAFASNAWFILLMIGVFAQITGLAELADHPLRGRRAVPARDAAGRVRRLPAAPSSSCTRSASSARARRRASARC